MLYCRTFLLALLFILSLAPASAQKSAEDIVREGIVLHDDGQFTEAIAKYQEALKLKPNWGLALYEISLSYVSLEDQKQALKYASKAMKVPGDHLISSAMVKANVLDDMGKGKKAIKVYNDALATLGEHYLLYYNLALTHFRREELTEAEDNLIKAIEINFNHASSHLLLSNLHANKGNRAQTAMAGFFFLLLEPESGRTSEGARNVVNAMSGGVSKKEGGNIQVNLTLGQIGGEFAALDMLIGMRQAQLIGENKDEALQPIDLLVANSIWLFEHLGENQEGNSGSLWYDFYAPFYGAVAAAGHGEAYVYNALRNVNQQAADWVEAHPDEVQAFADWMSEE